MTSLAERLDAVARDHNSHIGCAFADDCDLRIALLALIQTVESEGVDAGLAIGLGVDLTPDVILYPGAAVAFGLMGMAEAIRDLLPCVHCEAEEAATRLRDADWSLEEDEKRF